MKIVHKQLILAFGPSRKVKINFRPHAKINFAVLIEDLNFKVYDWP